MMTMDQLWYSVTRGQTTGTINWEMVELQLIPILRFHKVPISLIDIFKQQFQFVIKNKNFEETLINNMGKICQKIQVENDKMVIMIYITETYIPWQTLSKMYNLGLYTIWEAICLKYIKEKINIDNYIIDNNLKNYLVQLNYTLLDKKIMEKMQEQSELYINQNINTIDSIRKFLSKIITISNSV